MQNVVASVFRDGMVRIDLKCADGALPLCSGPMRDVTDAVARHCNLCYDGKGYKLGELALEADDGRALKIVKATSRQIIEELAYQIRETVET